MADYFIRFSFAVADLTDDECAWLTTVLASEDGRPSDELAVLLGDDDYIGFSATVEDDPRQLWVHDDGVGTPEHAASLVQEFLRRFRPGDRVGFEFANTCSRPRLDAFGGGAVSVTATGQRWTYSAQWLVAQEAEGFAPVDGLRAALACVAAHGFGVNVDADALVRNAAAGLVALYDGHHLREVSGASAADVCVDLYELMRGVGLIVA